MGDILWQKFPIYRGTGVRGGREFVDDIDPMGVPVIDNRGVRWKRDSDMRWRPTDVLDVGTAGGW